VAADFHQVEAAYQKFAPDCWEQDALFGRDMGEATDVVREGMPSVIAAIALLPCDLKEQLRVERRLNRFPSQGGVQRLWYTGPMFRF